MKRTIVLLAASLLILGSPIATAGAHEAGAASPLVATMTFQCQAQFQWPVASAGPVACHGRAVGEGLDGTTPFTATAEDNFDLLIDNYSVGCPAGAGDVPTVGQFVGSMRIGTSAGILTMEVSMELFGSVVVIQAMDPRMNSGAHSGTGGGVGVLAPVAFPLPTCQSPGSLNAILTGPVTIEGL